MQILIACAKDMTPCSGLHPSLSSVPMFNERAVGNALQMMRYDDGELQQMLRCNRSIAAENRLRYLHFTDPEPGLQALLAYAGIVYKYINPGDFTAHDFSYSNARLWIASFLYGLLRPMDLIKNYRLEGDVTLPDNGVTMFDYWKPLLTDVLIDSVKRDGGTLLDVASVEMHRLFDWRRVKKEVNVVRPEFFVNKGGRLKTVVIYAKMCRGAMTRHVIKNRIETTSLLKDFSFEGFSYSHADSTPDKPVFVL